VNGVACTGPTKGRRSSGSIARLVAGLLLVGTLVPAGPGVASTAAVSAAAASGDYSDLSLEQLLSVPVYAAAKRQQDVSRAPSSVTVITSAEIRAYGWRTLADLLRSVPGLYTMYPHTYGFLGIRGFGRPGDFGGRVLLMVNGHRLNDPLYDTAAIVEDFCLDLDLIERVEIVRGPGSALYGNNAFFAVINVLVREPGDVDGGEIAAQAGTRATWRGRLSWGRVWRDDSALLLSASGYSSRGDDPLYLAEFAENGSSDGRLFAGDDEFANRLLLHHRRGDLTVEGFWVERGRHAPPAWGMPPDVPRQTYDARGFAEARWEREVSSNLAVKSRLYFDWYRYWADFPYETDASSGGAARRVLPMNRDESLAESVGGEVQIDGHAGDRHAFAAGFEYRYDFHQSMRNFDVGDAPATFLDVDPETRIVGLYAQDEFRPHAHLGLTAGLRYDHYSSFGGALDPRLACVWNATAGTTLKLLYGRAFRAPNAYEFYYEDGGVSAKVNPDLAPERITTWEIVAERRLGETWRVTVTGFANDVTNLINEVVDPADSLVISANLDRARAHGVECQVECQLTSATLARASFTWTSVEDDATDAALPNSPSYLAKANVMTPVFTDRLRAGIEVQYLGARTTWGGRTLDEVTLANATVQTHSRRDLFSLAVSVHNLFDTDWIDAGAGALDTIGQDGRTALLTLRARY